LTGFLNSFYPVHPVNPVKFLSELEELNSPAEGPNRDEPEPKRYLAANCRELNKFRQ